MRGPDIALLIDGDLLAYRFAAACQSVVDWGDGVCTASTDLTGAVRQVTHQIENWEVRFSASQVVVALSDASNWRHSIMPAYKKNRSGLPRPLLLKEVRSYIRETWNAAIWPGLEADDVLGILSTCPASVQCDQKIIISADKDFGSVPGWLYNPQKDTMIQVSEEDAARFHLIQTLAGDPVDGYYGAPGVGAVTAKRWLSREEKPVPYEHRFRAGPRKGQSETRWTAEDAESPWDTVVSLYEKAGLSEQDALRNARVARILQAGDYNLKNQEVRLWTPSA